jgi:DNA polymerase phi
MFPAEPTGKKNKNDKKQQTVNAATDADNDALEPVDVLVDTVIGFLEQATAYMRAVANQVFSLLSESVRESTVDLILAVRLFVNPYAIVVSSYAVLIYFG